VLTLGAYGPVPSFPLEFLRAHLIQSRNPWIVCNNRHIAMHDVTFFTCSTCPCKSNADSNPLNSVLTGTGAHRVALVLQELNLAHRVESIDLDKPRDPEYLKVNPRGTVPSLRVDGVVLTESSIIVHFLTDSHPSHLLPASDVEGGPMRRARIAFFVETYMTKFNGPCTEAVIGSAAGQPADTGFEERLRKTVVAELEPLLSDAAPYFGGSERITLAEVSSCNACRPAVCSTDRGDASYSWAPSLCEC